MENIKIRFPYKLRNVQSKEKTELLFFALLKTISSSGQFLFNLKQISFNGYITKRYAQKLLERLIKKGYAQKKYSLIHKRYLIKLCSWDNITNENTRHFITFNFDLTKSIKENSYLLNEIVVNDLIRKQKKRLISKIEIAVLKNELTENKLKKLQAITDCEQREAGLRNFLHSLNKLSDCKYTKRLKHGLRKKGVFNDERKMYNTYSNLKMESFNLFTSGNNSDVIGINLSSVYLSKNLGLSPQRAIIYSKKFGYRIKINLHKNISEFALKWKYYTNGTELAHVGKYGVGFTNYGIWEYFDIF